MRVASPAETPWAASPWFIASGSDELSPTIMSEKKMPIESTIAEFWNVAANRFTPDEVADIVVAAVPALSQTRQQAAASG